MRKRTLFAFSYVCLLALTFTGCAKKTETVAPELIAPADQQQNIYSVNIQDVRVLETYEAKVTPALTELSFESSGILSEFCVSVGDSVSEGQILATLSGTAKQLEGLYEQYDKLLASHAAANRASEINIELSKLYGNDTQREELQLAQQKESQALEVNQLLSRIETAKKAVEAAEIVAPQAGTIVSLADLHAGDAIAYHSPVIALATSDSCYVTCDYMSEKAANDSIRCYVVIGNQEYDLEYVPYHTEELALAIKEGTAISRFLIREGDASLVGSYATIYRVLEEAKDVLTVPVNALYADGTNYYVYVMNGDTRMQTSVTVGVKGLMYAEIKEGLKEGDLVYVRE